MIFSSGSIARNVLLLTALIFVRSAAAQTSTSEEILFTAGDALRAAFIKNPELLDSLDNLRTTQVSEREVELTYLPQITPLFGVNRQSGLRQETYGLTLAQQFSFGPSVQGSIAVNHEAGNGAAAASTPYSASYVFSVTQPLLRGADPAVIREPLRQARRAVESSSLQYEALRRQAAITILQAYLGVAEQERVLEFAEDRRAWAARLTDFSRARFTAGTTSKLDLLRAEQEEASAEASENGTRNQLEDARELLRRLTGLPEAEGFCVEIPEELAEMTPALEDAVENVVYRRPEAIEAANQVHDAEVAIRIAKSQQLPSLDAVATYQTTGEGTSASGAIRAHSPSLTLGLSSQFGLNVGILAAERRKAEIELGIRKRDYDLLRDDLRREVRRTYRTLELLQRNHALAQNNLSVAELQVHVAQLRFEQGLSDNFNVVDAENSLNSTRLTEIDSRLNILVASLDCLRAAGLLDVNELLRSVQ